MSLTTASESKSPRRPVLSTQRVAKQHTENEPRRILVIDDNPAIHKDFEKILVCPFRQFDLDDVETALFGGSTSEQSSLNYETSHAMQGQEGYELAKAALEQGQPFDLAFVDMRMPPGWDGLETIENIWKVDPDLQVVICGAYSDYPLAEIRQRLGLNDRLLILKKPFEKSEVEQMAVALTEKRKLERKLHARLHSLEKLVSKYSDRSDQDRGLDPLTKLPNRYGLANSVSDDLLLLKSACVLVAGVDSLRQINSRYGYEAGDKILCQLATLLQQRVGEKGITSRIGDSEFLVLLPNTQQDEGVQMANDIGQMVTDHPFHKGIPVSTALGVSASQHFENAEELFSESSRILRLAKQPQMHEE